MTGGNRKPTGSTEPRSSPIRSGPRMGPAGPPQRLLEPREPAAPPLDVGEQHLDWPLPARCGLLDLVAVCALGELAAEGLHAGGELLDLTPGLAQLGALVVPPRQAVRDERRGGDGERAPRRLGV